MKKHVSLVLVFILLSGFGCQKPTQHILPTPHPTGPTNAGSVLYADSEVALGFDPTSYSYQTPDFSASDGNYTLTWSCYASEQGVPSSYQNATQTYALKVSVYTADTRAMLEPAVADVSCGHGKPPTGIETLRLPNTGNYYLLITANGPWTVEVDKA